MQTFYVYCHTMVILPNNCFCNLPQKWYYILAE